MKIYSCVWCGCELQLKDDVCFKHTDELKMLRWRIRASLKDDKREYKVHLKKVLSDCTILSGKIKEQLEIENALREAENKSNVMPDDEQQNIFRALGIAV